MTPTENGPPTESHHPCFLTEEQLLATCEVSQLRRGGPGGQHRNKVSTAIVVKHLASGILAEANERRSQVDNRRVALRRLRELLAIRLRSSPLQAVHEAPIRDTIRLKYGGSTLRIASDNWECATLLTILLDDIYQHDYQMANVAVLWRTSTSQVIRLLRDYPSALANINAARSARNLRPLK